MVVSPPHRLDHIGLIVRDLTASRTFYEGRLGMRFVEEGGDGAFRMMTLPIGAIGIGST